MDEFDDALKVEVLANLLRMNTTEASQLVETLATRLAAILPEQTTVERGGWPFLGERPVKELKINFDSCRLEITKEKSGKVHPRVIKIVRGVVLKTSTVSLDAWINQLATELSDAAQRNSAMKQALSDFVIG